MSATQPRACCSPFFLAIVLLLLIVLAVGSASAQTRPLRTPEAETIPAGVTQIQVGFDFLQDTSFPLSGLRGDHTTLGVIGLRTGVGRMVELQVEGAVRHFVDVREQVGSFVTPVLSGTRSASDYSDFIFYTKVRLLAETKSRPAVAFRFGYQMPNSNQVRGIGTNTTNIFAAIILQKHIRDLNVFGSVGLAILESPTTNFTQNDVITYGVGFIYPLHRRVNLAGEVFGRYSTREITTALLGTESRGQGRLGMQIFAGGFQWDFAGIAGIHQDDPKTGFTFGISRNITLFDYDKVR
ncbi:MAG TPA: hypothetical protein VGA40_08555 [Candidatus Acidoferrales bacterium]